MCQCYSAFRNHRLLEHKFKGSAANLKKLWRCVISLSFYLIKLSPLKLNLSENELDF